MFLLYSFSITPVVTLDFEALSTSLMFAACETRHCVNVTIVDDIMVESDEIFDINLERTSDLLSSIILNATARMIEITDNDGELCSRFVLMNL